MKVLFPPTLAVGILMAVLVQAISFAVPKEAYDANALSRSPEAWTISLDGIRRTCFPAMTQRPIWLSRCTSGPLSDRRYARGTIENVLV